jgi:hypothetical protein
MSSGPDVTMHNRFRLKRFFERGGEEHGGTLTGNSKAPNYDRKEAAGCGFWRLSLGRDVPVSRFLVEAPAEGHKSPP